jgi:hypothetical protein
LAATLVATSSTMHHTAGPHRRPAIAPITASGATSQNSTVARAAHGASSRQ